MSKELTMDDLYTSETPVAPVKSSYQRDFSYGKLRGKAQSKPSKSSQQIIRDYLDGEGED